MKKKLLNLIGIIFLSSIITSCCDDDFKEPSGIETRVFGKVFDNKNQIPISDYTLKISEWNTVPSCSFGMPSTEFIQYLDSILTDSNGYYDFTFKTSGQGDLYKLTFEHNDSIWTNYINPVEIENLGNTTELNFDFLHLYPVDLKITLDSNVEHLPISISAVYTFFTSSDRLTETNVEYTRRIYTNKNFQEVIKFSRRITNKESQAAKIIIPATNTTDLTEFEIFLTDSDFIDQ